MKVIRRAPLRKIQRRMLVIIILVTIVVPLLPLAVRSAWVYSSQSEFCISCHTMKKEYQNWTHSVHRSGAGCGDCHLPQQSIVTKLAGKTRDGIYHSYAYFFDAAPDPIRISKHGQDTIKKNCVRCHTLMLANIHTNDRKCWECHRRVFHGY
ncbi:cytochrome c nitrite reductase small subunit [Candidatus Magnetobacterium casense]|uniref:Cytochrome c nitrite reductase small subunit n=1 Tax=Candidatus Magnetobacterium casense TaxID=1455061 RepID=A0ABS6RVB9_9BACT|nr:cytochrome c nitrite reductase small subunit [Candidatus Magnetobacterium casensis]MBV6340580.1 cytochrome c nitrite reductase small subunit [Candidatus Magnetobacterium casensis]